MLSTNNTAVTKSVASANIFEQLSEKEHEQIVFCYDKETGLKSIIAVHNTILGPALGGTRFWNYSNEQDAINDVLRLSRGMTYKAAISGINLGGGKAVIIGDSSKDKSEALWRRYGKFVNSLNGKYITAEDVGTSTKDMEYVSMETKHVSGIPEYMGGSGDPSPFTAYGVFLGMKSCAKEVFGKDNLAGKKVLVQGVGHVGENLVKHLADEKAKIYISDINQDRLKLVAQQFGAEIIDSKDLFNIDMDIYAPCALGATINNDSIDQLKCSIVAGAANNQLADETIHADMLKDKGILYAPDFLINAGGLINVYNELVGYNRERAMANTEKIYELTTNIIKTAKQENITTHMAAMKLAEERIAKIAKVKATF